MNRIFLIYIISIIGFIYGMRVPPQNSPYEINKVDQRSRPEVRFLEGYVFGKMEYLTRLQKKEHSRLVIGHLVTPSGFHLASILFLLRPLFRFFRSKKSVSKDIFEIIILSISFFLPDLYAIKRMAIFRIAMLLNRNFKNPRHIFEIFLFTFLIDLIFFNFKYSTSSYWYSFLFFGVILANIDRGFKSVILPILGAQIICHYFEGSGFNLLASFFGIIFTQCFVLIFPLLILSYFLWINFHNTILLIPAHLTEKIIGYFSNISHLTSDIMIGPLTILLILLLSYSYKKLKFIPFCIYIICSFMYPLDCLNSRIQDFTSPSQALGSIPSYIKPIKSFKYRHGVRTHYSNGLICYEKLKGNVWDRKCKGFLDS